MAGGRAVRVSVDRTACSGHARCNAIFPEVFTLDDVGYSSVGEAEIPPGEENRARLVVASCPEHAVSIVRE